MMEERSDKDIISNFFLLEINREKRRNEKLGIKEFDESEFIKILEVINLMPASLAEVALPLNHSVVL